MRKSAPSSLLTLDGVAKDNETAAYMTSDQLTSAKQPVRNTAQRATTLSSARVAGMCVNDLSNGLRWSSGLQASLREKMRGVCTFT
jgi:hypothetical protein